MGETFVRSGAGLRNWLKRWLLIVLLASVAAETGYRAGLLAPLENIYTDFWHQFAGVRYQPQHVALVTVDDQSLASRPDTPLIFWTPHFARAVGVMRQVGVKVIGLDFLPVTTPENWLRRLEGLDTPSLRDYDLAFRQELNQGGVVMVATHTRDPASGEDGVLLPHQDYLLSLPGLDIPAFVGYANLVTDADGGVRRHVVQPTLKLPDGIRDGAPQWSFPALLARLSGASPVLRDGLIGFAGPPGTIRPLPISRLLADNAAADPLVRGLAGKVVIIGADFQGMGDAHFTPYSRGGGVFGLSGVLMTGPEVQANVVETLLSGRRIEQLGDVSRWVLLGCLVLLSVGLYSRLSPWHGLLVLFLAGGGVLVLGQWVFGADRIIPAAHLQLGLLTAFVACYGRRLTRESREKLRIRKLFSRYVSDDLVEMIVSAEKAPDLGGTYVPITVLFSDIRNFTSISERLEAHEVVEFLNAYFERICERVLAHGGSIDKFIGDAIMVEFGSPVPYPDHARRALRAAIAIRESAEGFAVWMAQRFPDRGLPPFAVGIGVHTGTAVVGNIGSRRRMEFTAIGDTVNLASRLEGATKDAGCVILASKDTVQAAGAGVTTGHTDTIMVKGRGQAVQVFEVLDLVEQESAG